MKKCIVIGGGVAGLTAAAYLVKSGVSVELIEASPKLGGRAYSFKENQTGSIIDNGQHIMMGCYRETLKFFRLIGAERNLIIQKRLKVNFLKENFQSYPLNTIPIPYPINLIYALLNYKALSIYDRITFLKFFIKLPFIQAKELENSTVYEWLIKENQNENIRKAFWEILAVGALNTNIHKASAAMFSLILKEMFLSGNKASTIIIPKFGLTETYCNDAEKFLENNGGKVCLLETIEKITVEEEKAAIVETSKRKIKDFDFIISAVPDYSLKKFFQDSEIKEIPELEYSSILSIHIWLKDNDLKDDFYGLIGSPIHWIFNHNDHLTLVISDAGDLINLTKEELLNIAAIELEKFTQIKKEQILNYKVIKEKRATFIPSYVISSHRPNTATKFENLFLAGDWINTGLPSTIESAAKSGRAAAELVLKNINSNLISYK